MWLLVTVLTIYGDPKFGSPAVTVAPRLRFNSKQSCLEAADNLNGRFVHKESDRSLTVAQCIDANVALVDQKK